MMRILLPTLLIGGLVLAACTVVVPVPRVVIGSGTVTTESRPVQGFSKIELAGAGDLTITQSGEESLVVETDDNILPLLKTEVRGDTLYIGFEGAFTVTPTTLKYTVTVKTLEELNISGAGRVVVHDLAGDRLEVNTSGAGSIEVAGTVTRQKVSMSGAGSYDAKELACQIADVSISGLGSAVVNVSERLEVSISGAGTVEYIGNPTVTQNISGLGRVHRR